MNGAPNCYKCAAQRNSPGDAHSQCMNLQAKVTGSPHGIRNGWFFWPFNYDPVWLESCTGFIPKEQPAPALEAQNSCQS